MKKWYLLLILITCGAAAFSQPLFTYGNTVVDKAEFLRAYNKNKTPVTDKEKALRDYLDLYTRFKLKVKAAKDLHLDTLQQLQFDLQNFRSQVDEGYMNNEKALNELVEEAFLRSQKDIHVIHFYAAIDANMSPADTVNAWSAMSTVEEKLKAGTFNYEELVQSVSKNPVKVKTGDLGFVTAFSIPYEYENIVYRLKPGEASKPYRSANGLHVFKVLEERKSIGKWKVAQIMLAFPPGDPALFMSDLRKKADSIYTALKQGADFSGMAKAFSDDKLTYLTGGELPEFGTGKYENSFEKEILKLTSDGELSPPFSTSFGFHIIKRLKQTPIPADKSEASFLYDLKQKVLQDSRIFGARDKFVKEILSVIGYKKNPAVKDADLFRYADSVAARLTDTIQRRYPISDKVIFSFSKDNVKGSEWLDFIRNFKGNAELYKGESNKALLDKFTSSSAQDYYKKHLEDYNADFRYQMDEFRDGNILFEIMERNIWGKAAGDTVGLLKYYGENKEKYKWAPSAAIILFSCTTKAIATDAVTALRNGKQWKLIVEEGNNMIQADSGRYELSQLPLPPGINAVPGLITEPLANATDGSASFIRVLKLYDGGLQRTFDEARGLVINDYQNVMEERWVDELKKKYPVKVNETVFQSLLK